MRHVLLMQFVKLYEAGISWTVGHLPGADKLAHTYAGLLLWLGFAMILRHSLRSWKPVAFVVLMESANECVDRVAHGNWALADTSTDFLATLFFPVLLTFALRRLSHLRG